MSIRRSGAGPDIPGARRAAGRGPAVVALLAAALGLLAPCHRARAQLQSFEGKTVRRIAIEGNRRISGGAARISMRTREGEPLVLAVLNEDIKKLYELGFSKVKALAQAEGDGVAIRFVVEESSRISKIDFRGVDHFDRAEVEGTLDLRSGQFVSDLILKLAAQDLERRYRQDGYEFVDVKIQRLGRPEGIELVILVIEGPRVAVKDVNIIGHRHMSASDIRGVMQTERSTFLRTRYLDRETLEQDIVAIKRRYRDEGYRDAEVAVAELWYNQARERVSVTIAVREGERYTLGDIRIEGNQLFSEREILEVMTVKPGDPLVWPKLASDVQIRIPRLYGKKGYIRIRVTPRLVWAEAEPAADLVIEIDEGKKIFMGEISIEGNRQTRDKVIRRKLSLAPGDPVDLDEIIRSRYRLLDSGFFEPGSVDFVEVPSDDPESDIQDWVVRVREGQTGWIKFAVGIGSNSGVIGDISLTKRNFDVTDTPESFEDLLGGGAFTGAGQTLFISLSPGTELSRYRLGFREPFLFDTNNSLSAEVYRRLWLRPDYDEQRQGLKLRLGRYLSRFDPDLAVEFHVRAEQVKLDDFDQDAPQDAFDSAGYTNVLGVGPSLRYQQLDRPGFPTKGLRAEISCEFVGGILGGDVDMNRVDFDTRGFFPVYEDDLGRRHVISLWSRLGWSEATRDTPRVPIFDRFFAGGRGSIRGFDFRGVGPQAKGEPVGGEVLVLGGVEYEFPLLEDMLRGTVFIDAGTVAESVHSDDFRRFRASAGFGFRLKIPIFGQVPFALDIGFPFFKQPDDDRQTVSFSLGAPFWGASF